MDTVYDFDPTIEVNVCGTCDNGNRMSYYTNMHNIYPGFKSMAKYGFPNHSVNINGQVINNINGQLVAPTKTLSYEFRLTFENPNTDGLRRTSCDLRKIIGELFVDEINPTGPYTDFIREVQDFYAIPLIDKRLVTHIEGYNYKIYITRHGEVWKNNPIKRIHTYMNGSGYLIIDIFVENTYRNKKGLIHRLVAQYFCPKPEHLKDIPYEELQVNHKDGNKLNNNWWNLEWCTHKENMEHASKTNLMKYPFVYKDKIRHLNQLLCNNSYTLPVLSKMTGLPIHAVRSIRAMKIKSYNHLLTPELWKE